MSELRMRALVMVAFAALVAACGGQRSGDGAADQTQAADTTSAEAAQPMPQGAGQISLSVPQGEDDTVVNGVVRSVGADPFAKTVVATSDGASVAVSGDLASEIAQLLGAQVRVWGTAEPNAPPPPPRAVDVRGYEILVVGGGKPTVGILGPDGRTLNTLTRGTIPLTGVPDDMAAMAGAKVWVVGVEEGGGIAVQSYGVIRR